MKYIKTFEQFINEGYFPELEKVTIDSPCTIFMKNKKKLSNVEITKENKYSLEWKSVTDKSNKGKVDKKDISDISYKND